MRRLLVCAISLLGVALPAPLAAQETDKQPPKAIIDILAAPPRPGVLLSPDRKTILLTEQRGMPGIDALADQMLALAGTRINPRTNGPYLAGRIAGLVLKRIEDGAERRVTVPQNPAIGFVSWSPDAKRIAFTHTTETGVELWIADAITGQARAITGAPLNAVAGPPCRWMPGSTQLLCQFVPEGRGAAPERGQAAAPTTHGATDSTARAGAYRDLLRNAHDEALFTYYFTAQLALVDAATGTRTSVGEPGIFDQVEPSPSGFYFYVSRIVPPYSYLVPAALFPKELAIWNAKGEVVRSIGTLPLAEAVPAGGVRTGPREANWHPERDPKKETLMWVEALDGGDPAATVEHRDRTVTIQAPFKDLPLEFGRLQYRFAGVVWDEDGMAFLTEYDRERRWTRAWLIHAGSEKHLAFRRMLWNKSVEDRYENAGKPLMHVSRSGMPVMERDGQWIFLVGEGASPKGQRPFLDRVNVFSRKKERLWQADTIVYETVIQALEDNANEVLTRRESRTEPPNYFVRHIRRNRLRQLTSTANPAPQLAGIQTRLVTYVREDSLPLSGTLYLPPDYRPGAALPTIVWASAKEFTSKEAAGQVSAAPNRFIVPRGASHLFLLLHGYAVFEAPDMPMIVGDSAAPRDEQMSSNARAAVKALVDLGVADSQRIGIGGHGDDAFLTAALLAQTDLFRAGIALTGTYVPTVTPVGHQRNSRPARRGTDIDGRLARFQRADKITEPLLIVRDAADSTSVTGPGKNARYVSLPPAAHGYAVKENVVQTIAEMIEWMDKYVKNAQPRQGAVGRH